MPEKLAKSASFKSARSARTFIEDLPVGKPEHQQHSNHQPGIRFGKSHSHYLVSANDDKNHT